MRKRTVTRVALGLAALTALATPLGAARAYEDQAGEPWIINGHEAPAGRFPFMVSLEVKRGTPVGTGPALHFCGGTLIDREWVMTAAHCMAVGDAGDFVAVIGRTRLSDQDSGVVRNIREVFVHPDYDGNVTEGADVALLRLAAPVDGITPLEPIRDDERAAWEPGDPATVAGWGVTDPEGRSSDDLLSVDVAVQDDAKMASEAFYGKDFKASDMVAAGPDEGGFGPCFGDSGGPLLVEDGFGMRQIGIVSWGAECAAVPAVFARVGDGRVREFIDSKIPLRVSDARTTEGGVAQFKVTLSRPSTGPVALHFATASVTAISGTDFTPLTGDLRLPVGATSAVITVLTTEDTEVERDETFRLILSGVEGTTMAATGPTGLILDDD